MLGCVFIDMELIVELNGIKYLLFEAPITPKNGKKLEQIVQKYNGIIQGIGQVKSGFWGVQYAIAKVLIPEEFVHDFHNEKLS